MSTTRTVVDVLTGPDYAAYLDANGARDARDDREALGHPARSGNVVPARKAIYGRLAATAAGWPDGRDGSTTHAREAAARRCLAAWPKAWSIEAQAAVDPIFDDRWFSPAPSPLVVRDGRE